MKSRVLMAALVAALLMGSRLYASDCGPCDPACDPCGDAGCVKSVDLFAGLKSLVAHRSPCSDAGECGPCDGVVACTPCDEAACDPCGDLGCNDGCSLKFSFGRRLKGLFASKGCGTCDVNPCDEIDNGNCGPCDDLTSCNDHAFKHTFKLKKLFKGFALGGHCDTGCGNPCDAAGDCNLGDCNPCDEIGNGDCNPCDELACGPKFGSLLDKPRRGLKKLFDGLSFSGCDTGCGPCDPVCDPCADVNPCDIACPAASKLPEAAK